MSARLSACLLCRYRTCCWDFGSAISCLWHIRSNCFFAQTQMSGREGARTGQIWFIVYVGWWEGPVNTWKPKLWKYPEEEKGWPEGLSNSCKRLRRTNSQTDMNNPAPDERGIRERGILLPEGINSKWDSARTVEQNLGDSSCLLYACIDFSRTLFSSSPPLLQVT